jgi:Ca-activated chloride channel homolog
MNLGQEFILMRFSAFLILLPSVLLSDSAGNLTFRSDVEMVTLAFRVALGNRYVADLKPSDIQIFENGREQRIETFSHPRSAPAAVAEQPESIFLLIDSSNAMYSGFAYARDAIADFIRSVDSRHSLAVYTFSRNIARITPLTRDRQVAIASLSPSSGDDTALYNAMLLTLRDAARVPGP